LQDVLIELASRHHFSISGTSDIINKDGGVFVPALVVVDLLH